MTDRSAPRRLASSLSALAVSTALVAALLVPILVMVLAGASLDAQTIDGHAAGDAAGTASAAVGGAQRLLAGGRDAAPVSLPPCLYALVSPADDFAAIDAIAAPSRPRTACGDAAATTEAARRF